MLDCVMIWNIMYLFTSRADGVMRTMNTEKLLKTLPIVQNQMDSLLDFNVSWFGVFAFCFKRLKYWNWFTIV